MSVIKAVAFDLDGTLLNSNHQISEFNKEMIFKLRESGVKVFLATGRLYKSLYKYKEELKIDMPVICYNGAMVVDPKTDERVFEIALENHIVKELVFIARANNIHLNLFHGDTWYIEATREEVETYKKSSGLEYHLITPESFPHINVNKAMFVGENKRLLEIDKMLDDRFGKSIYKAFSRPHFLEVLNKDTSKGKALIETLRILHIPASEVMAFGDAYNDIEMLRGVGIGIAMGNAPEDMRSQFDIVTDTNDNDGVGKFLKNYFGL